MLTPRLMNGERVEMTKLGSYKDTRELGFKGKAAYKGDTYDIWGAPCSIGFTCCCDAIAVPEGTDTASDEDLQKMITPPKFGAIA